MPTPLELFLDRLRSQTRVSGREADYAQDQLFREARLWLDTAASPFSYKVAGDFACFAVVHSKLDLDAVEALVRLGGAHKLLHDAWGPWRAAALDELSPEQKARLDAHHTNQRRKHGFAVKRGSR